MSDKLTKKLEKLKDKLGLDDDSMKLVHEDYPNWLYAHIYNGRIELVVDGKTFVFLEE